MAQHSSIASMLKESLLETFMVAQYCVKYQKDPKEWGTPGCYGYPSAMLLFSIVDSMGSYYRGDKDFTVLIDGKKQNINNDGFHHFYILNSKYYDLNLSGEVLKKLYKNYRSVLIHNAVLPYNYILSADIVDLPFDTTILNGINCMRVNLLPFLEYSRKAIIGFLKDIDSIVPTSKQLHIIEQIR